MWFKSRFAHSLVLILAFLCLTLCSCGKDESGAAKPASSQKTDPASSSQDVPSATPEDSPSESIVSETAGSNSDAADTGSESSATDLEAADIPEKTGNRDNTPYVLVGMADGLVTYGNESVTIDASHTSDGYLMVTYTGSNSKVKLQLTGSNEVTYTYNLHGGYETFPLTSGSGSYTVGVFENIEGTSYSTLFTQSIDVSITNEFAPFLYANQYVDFSSDSDTVKEGSALADGAGTDLEVIENIYNYIITNFTYDYEKASSVESGYLPDVDEIFHSQTGICFDYAAVMATMLRTQRIPTRLEVGYMGDVYHAWISTYIEDQGWINGIISFDGKEWKLMDPTFASTSTKPKDFITNNQKYTTKYVY